MEDKLNGNKDKRINKWRIKALLSHGNKMALKGRLIGRPGNRKGLFMVCIYTMLVALGFVYLYPILNMVVSSFMTLTDLLDASVKWIPTAITFENYKKAFEVMHVKETLMFSVLASVGPALLQTAVAAMTGYAFGRFDFPFKKLFMVLVMITFVVPPYVLMVPTYTMYSDYGLLGSLKTLLLPAMFGQGLKSAIFILIFMQFFRQIPKALDEAARVDGASELTIFFRIAIPLAVPAIIISFLFSLVWYWNETYFTALYLGGNNLGDTSSVKTMLIELNNFTEIFKQQLQAQGGWASGVKGGSDANEAIRMAATVITILPLLIVYFVLQRYFVEGIDRTGITGE